jgi:hypothetical protein
MKIPASAAADVQQSFRDVWATLAPWTGGANLDFHGRRIINAGSAIADFDYVTLADLRRALAKIETEIEAPAPGTKQTFYGTHAQRLARAPNTVPDGSFFEETDRGALYQSQQLLGVATWVLYFGFMTGSYSAKPGDLGLSDDNFWYNAQDQATLSRWTGSAWHYQIGILIDTFANRPASGGTNIATGFRFAASDRGFQEWWYDRAATVWKFAGGGQPTRGTLASITGSLGTNDAGYLYFATDFDRVYRWTGSAWEDAPGQPMRGMMAYFRGAQLPGTGWGLCDGTTYTMSTSTAGTQSYVSPNLTGSNRFVRAVSGATDGTGGSATTHTHQIDPPSTAVTGTSGNDVGTPTVVQSGTGASAPAEPHPHGAGTYAVDIAAFASAGPSGTGGDDALPPYLNLRPYVRL